MKIRNSKLLLGVLAISLFLGIFLVSGQGVSTSLGPIDQVEIFPPILLLSSNADNTGELKVIARDSEGHNLDLSKFDVEFRSSNPGFARVNENGSVTALRSQSTLSETPVISARVDGVQSSNVVVVKVFDNEPEMSYVTLSGENVSFYIPARWDGVSFENVFKKYQAPKVGDLAYSFQKKLTGVAPKNQWIVGEPGRSDEEVPCGLSGNPIRLGLNISEPFPHNNCIRDPQGFPHWDVILHELGHNFTLGSTKFGQLYGQSSLYIEAYATLARMYAENKIARNFEKYELSLWTKKSINKYIEFNRRVYLGDLRKYMEENLNFEDMNPNILDGIFLKLADNFGWEVFPSMFEIFQPPEDRWRFLENVDTEEEVHTFTICALSTVIGEDLRKKFRSWRFPIDEEFYEKVKPKLEALLTGKPLFSLFRPLVSGKTVLVDGSVEGADRIVWNWGGGENEGGTLPNSNTYSGCGTYTISATAFSNSKSVSESTKVSVPSGQMKTDPIDNMEKPFLDIVKTSVNREDSRLVFSMRLNGKIKSKVENYTFFIWSIDPKEGNDFDWQYNIRVFYDPDLFQNWKATVDTKSDREGEVKIWNLSENHVIASVTIPELEASKTRFQWRARTNMGIDIQDESSIYQYPPRQENEVALPKRPIIVATPEDLPGVVQIAENISLTVRRAGPETPLDLKIENSKIAGLAVNFRKVVENVRIAVRKLKKKPSEVPKPPGLVHAYTEVSTNVPEDEIENAGITFWVLKGWLATHEVSEENVMLLRYHEGAWENLPTNLVGENGAHIKYEAETPGFSTFAITAKAKAGVVRFSLKNLTISKDTLKSGESAIVSVDMSNTGEAKGSKTVKLWIDGGIADRRTVTLLPGESTTVKFPISREVVGTYEVSVGEMSESFEVKRAIEPAKFEVTDLILGKGEVKPGETTTIEVEVKNTGGKEGTYTVELSINGEIKTRSVSLGPGVYRMVPFKISRGKPNAYKIEAGGLSKTLKVKKPEKVEKPEEGIPWLIIGGVIIVAIAISAFALYRRK
ncbi:hypothetical protein AKJ65_02365 [candidate division MSBL1 archaeon SCGC-AAA259E19]|uniref:PKD domain-containing protein n=1 Tax=candidate division MSBL1 archaeon SCGC-AAA259E19 TaxID=1698264 RepID=A0A133UM43_9EURY|nr:hypothetical protein AKJ65_02365 [candidate division MSBL1 archaeon SCGC-AAA259E19]